MLATVTDSILPYHLCNRIGALFVPPRAGHLKTQVQFAQALDALDQGKARVLEFCAHPRPRPVFAFSGFAWINNFVRFVLGHRSWPPLGVRLPHMLVNYLLPICNVTD